MGIHPSLARHHASTGQFAGARTDSLSSKIVTAVRDALFAKKMKPGEFLGTENELADRFGVTLTTEPIFAGFAADPQVAYLTGAA